MVSSNLLLNNNKESIKKDNDEKDEKMQIKITGAFWMSVLVFIQERIMWLISRTSKTDTKTKKKTVIDVIRKFYKTKIRNSTPQSAIIHLPILYIILIALNILWIDLSQILLKHEMWIFFVLGKIALFFFWVSISCIFALYIVSYTKEIINMTA